MKTTYILIYALCLCAISMSCNQNTKTKQKVEPKANIEVPDSLDVDTIEKVNINNSTIEIYTASNTIKTKTYEFWYEDSKQVHFVQYPFFEINYKWIVDLDLDGKLEVIRARGYEDGVNYGIYEKKKNSEELLLNFNPALLDNRYPNQVFLGYPWDMEKIVLKKEKILSSFIQSYERDDNYSIPEEQKQMPFVFFHGKTTQPEFKLKIKPSEKEYTTLEKLITQAFHSQQIKYVVPVNWYVYDSASMSINNLDYKILLLEKLSEKNNKGNWHFHLPVIVLQNNIEIDKNDDVVFTLNDNCPADGFDAIVAKDNYFTIEQVFCADFLFVRSYTTFKIDTNTDEIILHKYGEEFTDRSNPDLEIPHKVWTISDFGEVLFRETTESFLKELRLTKW